MTPTTGAIPVLDLRDSPCGWHLRWLADCERSPGMQRLRYCCLRASGGGCCASPFPLRRRCPLQNSGTRSPGRRGSMLSDRCCRPTLHASSSARHSTQVRAICQDSRHTETARLPRSEVAHGKSIRLHRYRGGVLDCSLRPENAGPRRAAVCRCRVARGHG